MAKNTELKNNNINSIRALFYDGNSHTKNELSKVSGLSLASTTNILQHLLENDEIRCTGVGLSTGGRKSKNYMINSSYKHLGLIALSKKEDKYIENVYVVDLLNNVLEHNIVSDSKGEIEDIELLVEKLTNQYKDMSQIVISIPGVCINGVVDYCDYKQLDGIDIKKILEDQYHIDVVIENDVNVGCVGLSLTYPNISNLAYIYQPGQDYVGCGMIINNKLHNGFSHFAGELRYLPMYDHLTQTKMLDEKPKELLKKQMLSLISVINPEVIGYNSDVFEDEITFDNEIPKQHLPKLVRIKQFDDLVEKGLFNIGIQNIKERGNR